jgi:hypothetical protein
MPNVNAHLTKAILKSGASSDGKYGLMGFQRKEADSQGSDAIWIGVPVALLPHLAVSAISAIPQPGGSLSEDQRAVFEIDAIQVGSGPDGQMVLTTTFQAGAALSVRMGEPQARALLQGLEALLGKSDLQAPPGKKPN